MAHRTFGAFRHFSSTLGPTDIYVTSNINLRRKAGVKPLNGVKVALLNRSNIGGFSAHVLEDYGADVKRFCEPLTPEQNDQTSGRLIDLTKQEDVNLIKNVARKVDVLVDYLHERRLEQAGLIPEELLTVNSKLILARVSGFGVVSGQFGGDAVFGAMSGAMSTDRNGEDLETVLKEAHALTLSGRSHIITGLAMALFEREHTGKGQIIDFSVTDSISYIKQVADRSRLKIPDDFHRFYRTADRLLLAVAVISPKDQQKLLDILQIKSSNKLAEAISKQKQRDLLEKLKDIETVSPIVHLPGTQ